MDIHKNARLTLRRREDLVEYVARGVALKLAAASFSVTPKTAAKWVHRFRREGPPGLWLCPVFCVNDQALFLGLQLFLGMGCKGRGHFPFPCVST